MIEKKDILSLLIILSILIVVFVLFLDKRPFTDEGSFCTIAQSISRGAVLYKDIYNEKAPLPYLIASLFIKVSDNPITILRIIAFFFFCLTTFLLYFILKADQVKMTESIAITSFYIISAPLFQSFNYTAEIIGTPLILFISYQVKKDSDNKINLITGFFAGLLFFVKQPFGLFVIIVFIIATISKNMRRHFLIGFFVSLFFMYIILHLKGIYTPFIDNLLFTLKRYDMKSYMRLPYQNEYYQFALLIIFFSVVFIRFYLKAIGISLFLLVLSLMVVGIVRMDAFKMLPLLTILIYFFSSSQVLNRANYLTFIMVVLSFVSVMNYKDILIQNFDRVNAISYTIQTKVDKEESIWIAPHEANIYCLSKRRPSSKYFFLLPWINRPEVLITLGEDLMRRDPPTCIVDVSRFNNATEYNLELMVPEFKEILKGYNDIQEINGAVIYCKN